MIQLQSFIFFQCHAYLGLSMTLIWMTAFLAHKEHTNSLLRKLCVTSAWLVLLHSPMAHKDVKVRKMFHWMSFLFTLTHIVQNISLQSKDLIISFFFWGGEGEVRKSVMNMDIHTGIICLVQIPYYGMGLYLWCQQH